jgi:hypothetical protein
MVATVPEIMDCFLYKEGASALLRLATKVLYSLYTFVAVSNEITITNNSMV